MKIKMLHRAHGSYDGIHVKEYHPGEEYQVGEHHHMPLPLAEVFLTNGTAEEIKEAGEKPGPKEIKEQETPRNKK